MNYVDTSVLVAALVKEIHTPRAQRWLTPGESEDFAISDWVIAEFSSALSMKLRLGSIALDLRRSALEALGIMIEQSMVLLPVTGVHFRMAARFADQHQLGLRAPDALHLAIAAERGAVLCTMDKRLAGAAGALGVLSRLV